MRNFGFDFVELASNLQCKINVSVARFGCEISDMPVMVTQRKSGEPQRTTELRSQESGSERSKGRGE
jgi:hypothetical protein